MRTDGSRLFLHDEMARFVLTLVVISAFGPYLYSGVRTEQLAVYGLAALLLPFLWPRIRPSGSLRVVLAGWIALVAIAALQSGAAAPANLSPFMSGSALASLDNIVLPIVVAVLTMMLVTQSNREALLRRVAALTAVGMCLNTLVALIHTVAPLPLLPMWWGTTEDGVVVGDRAVAMGRYPGIMNQPALAGVLYSIALLCAIYWLHRRPVRLGVAVTLICVGGVLAVSKAFLLVGLPIGGWHLLRLGGKRQQRMTLLLLAVVALWGAGLSGLMRQWSGVDQLMKLLPGTEGIDFARLTGERYGESSALRPVVEAVMSEHPWFGYGLQGLDKATDAAWVQALVLAGVAGAVALGITLVALVWGYRTRRHLLDEPERRLFVGFVLVVVVTSFAFPVLTGNRLAVIVWILMVLLMSYPTKRQQDRIESETRGDSRTEPAASSRLPHASSIP